MKFLCYLVSDWVGYAHIVINIMVQLVEKVTDM